MNERISKVVSDALEAERREIQKQRTALTWRITEAEKAVEDSQAFIVTARAQLEKLDAELLDISGRLDEKDGRDA
jgi:chromosome segregation ATPase